MFVVMSTNASLFSLSLPSTAIFLPINIQVYKCFNLTTGTIGITVFSFVSILFLLPLYIFVLYLGLKKWQQQSASTPTSHVDFLTYSAVPVELLSVLGSTLISLGLPTVLSNMVFPGISLLTMQLFGQMTYHILTCLEHYLAVVHPIFYRGLKNAKGIRRRNIVSGCSGLLWFSTLGLHYSDNAFITFFILFFSTIISFVAICFCSISVLCVLFRPRPAKVGGCRQQVDQSRLRAFNTIFAILAVMLVKLIGHTVGICLYAANMLEDSIKCNLWISALWMSMPNALLLPMLYLKKLRLTLKGTVTILKTDNVVDFQGNFHDIYLYRHCCIKSMVVAINVINALAHWQCMSSNRPVCSLPFFILLHVNKKQKRSQQVYYVFRKYKSENW